MESRDWYSVDSNSVLECLETTSQGLTSDEAHRRLKQYGPNELQKAPTATALTLFVGQFKSILVIILIFSAIVSAFISMRKDEPLTDMYVILIIVVMNALLGFVQEYRAERAVEALQKMVAPHVIVIRDGREESIASKELVPGDVIHLEAGSRVPADARLIQEVNLQIDEASLTGESTAVTKNVSILPADVGIGDQRNMVFMGTTVTNGRAVAVVVVTGMHTQFGKIAGMVISVKAEEPPLKKKMEQMGRQLGLISLILTIFVFLIGVFVHMTELETMFMMGVSLAVSAIPEGLPAVLTITIALGVSRMARQKAIVRKLASVETLGSTTVICSDKTGTLTKNEMTVSQIYTYTEQIHVTGAGYIPRGEFIKGAHHITLEKDSDLEQLLRIGTLCNNARLQDSSEGWSILGDPTEGALIVLAAKAGIDQNEQRNAYPRINEIPFESARKMMTTIHETSLGETVAYVKGAPEVILQRCVSLSNAGQIQPLTHADRNQILETTMNFAGSALRVLALSCRSLPSTTDFTIDEIEDGLTFIGLVAMRDPPREEVPHAIQICRDAGIRTVMVTGDHKRTAFAIAQQIGILDDEALDTVFTGDDLQAMSDSALDEVVQTAKVFARVSPEHKMRIAQSLKRNGHIVAMTGDGVNDAPALKAADIGIAMGIKGTDVTREASDMILEDDNFATIVRAVQGGRHIYDNVAKYVRLMLTANFDEFLEITLVTLLGLPLPFLPIHVLWINLVTDGLPAVALSLDPPDPDLMRYPPRDPREGLLSRFWRFILYAAALDFISDFIPFLWTYLSTGDAVQARTVAFTSIVFFEIFLAYQCRSETRHIFELGWKGWTENKLLFVTVVTSFLTQFAILYTPMLNTIFKVVPLSPLQLGISILGSFTAFLILPGKLIKKRQYHTSQRS
jgi:Ca2+-transporting ATPase